MPFWVENIFLSALFFFIGSYNKLCEGKLLKVEIGKHKYISILKYFKNGFQIYE